MSSAAPDRLSTEAQQLWDRIMADYQIADQAGQLVLQAGLEAFDRLRQAQALLEADGLIVTDRYGQRKAHPATAIERDCRSAVLAAFRLLKLEPGEAGAL